MEHLYLIGKDLDEIEQLNRELMAQGLHSSQCHVYSRDENGIAKRGLSSVGDFSKTDVVQSAIAGLAVGILLALMLLIWAQWYGVSADIGFAPIVMMSLILVGISTWEGGLWGIQHINRHFSKVSRAVKRGGHVCELDFPEAQHAMVFASAQRHPSLHKIHL